MAKETPAPSAPPPDPQPKVTASELYEPDADAADPMKDFGLDETPAPEPVKEEANEAPDAKPHDRDKGLQKLSQDFAVEQRSNKEFRDQLGQQMTQLTETIGALKGQEAPEPEQKTGKAVVEGVFDEIDVYNPDEVREAMGTVAERLANQPAGKMPEELTQQLAKLEERLEALSETQTKSNRDNYWDKWSDDHKSITEEQRDTAWKQSAEAIDKTFGYAEGGERDAAINVEFNHQIAAMEKAAEAPPADPPKEQPKEEPKKPHPHARQPASSAGARITEPGTGSRTVAPESDVPLVTEDQLYEEEAAIDW